MFDRDFNRVFLYTATHGALGSSPFAISDTLTMMNTTFAPDSFHLKSSNDGHLSFVFDMCDGHKSTVHVTFRGKQEEGGINATRCYVSDATNGALNFVASEIVETPVIFMTRSFKLILIQQLFNNFKWAAMWPHKDETTEQYASRLFGEPLVVVTTVQTPFVSERKVVEAMQTFLTIKKLLPAPPLQSPLFPPLCLPPQETL